MSDIGTQNASGLSTRGELEARERAALSPHASFAGGSLGRLHGEEEHGLRTAFQRDRDRLIHCTAFRRLEYKTQVFVNHEGDYYRTRLTHTLEVVQVARSLARFLKLNEDLTEAMALAHDMGHTPFGHTVEEVMNEWMADEGGFEHNAQGLRSVDLLETPYPDFRGLNLSYEVRSIFTKKRSMAELLRVGYAAPESKRFDAGPTRPILEAQIVDIADGVAYNSHDVDDGIKAGLITLDQLEEVPLWSEIWKDVRGTDGSRRRHEAIRQLINRQVNDIAEETHRRMRTLSETTKAEEIPEYPALRELRAVVSFSEKMGEQNKILKNFLRDNLYHHPQVTRKMNRACGLVRCLCDAYSKYPDQMAEQFLRRAKTEPLRRVVCDYVAGMTDRFAEEEYRGMFVPDPSPTLIR